MCSLPSKYTGVSTVDEGIPRHCAMKFFVPSLDDHDSLRAFREIRSSFQEATGWPIADEPFYRLEYLDSSGPKTAAVGQDLFGRKVRAIFESDQAMIVCTHCENARCAPVFVAKRDIVEIEPFERGSSEKAPRPEDKSRGIATFLFTDIEGSTRFWEEHPAHMRYALRLHDSTMERAILGNSGLIFNTAGDAYFSVFDSVPDAAQAALDAQSALGETPWPEQVPIRVRMAVHVGEAAHTAAGYVGASANHAAKLLGLAHGGQILVSEDAADLCNRHMPDGSALWPLGNYMLGQTSGYTRVFQLVHPSLKLEHPPLREAIARGRASDAELGKAA